jgi:glycosyltransferase involved in cell wall biosynthesis
MKKKDFNPLVSIIIPVYNGSNYMREAIDSALAQTYKNIEIILVNDGSTDNTDEIAGSYGDKIRYFKKENGGVSSALNLAIREMRGEYFSWLSHDDVYYPDKIEKQINFLSKLPNKNIALYSDYVFIDEESITIRKVVLDHQMLEKKIEYALLRGAINGCTLLIPKKAFDKYGYFDENLKCTQDYAKWFEMMGSYDFVHMTEVLVKYRLHNEQDTNKNPLAISEGDALWINMMNKLTLDRKIKLEGSEYDFYREMEKFLKNTPYKKAAQFSINMMQKMIQRNKGKKLAISIIAHASNKNGAERAMLDMIDILLKNNIFVHVIFPGEGPLKQELINRNIFYDEITVRWWANVDKNNNIEDEINDNVIEIAYILNRINPDIVYTISSVVSVGAIAANILGIPHIWNIAEFGREEHGIKYLLSEDKRIQFIRDYSSKIFFVSKAIKKYYNDKVNIEDKAFIFPPITNNIVNKDDEAFKVEYFKEDVLRIAILGNIVEGKGQKDAILAICEIIKEKKDIELIIAGSVGDESYCNELKEIISINQAWDNIKFIGYIDNSNHLIKQSDIILVCSVFEGFGRVTIEAMLNKKPVIGANSGATPELIENGKNGFLYEAGDFGELTKKIEFFMGDGARIVEFGENGYNFAKEKFDENMYGEKLLNELNELKGKRTNVFSNSFDMLISMIFKRNKRICELELENRKKEREKEKERGELMDEINLIKSSKFWKLRGIYLKLKFILLHPIRCLKKYKNILWKIKK